MKKLILTVMASTILIVGCKNKTIESPKSSSDNVSSTTSQKNNLRLNDNRYKALNNNNIQIARIIFKGYTAKVKADFWKFKLESWRDNIHTPQVEIDAINNLLPKITEELYTVSDSDKVYLDFINYMESDWVKSIQPYINYERLMLLIASPYYPETSTSAIIVGGSSGGGGGATEECECNLSRSSDFCNGMPGGGTGGGAAKQCVRTGTCAASAHGCGWAWIMTCRGQCR